MHYGVHEATIHALLSHALLLLLDALELRLGLLRVRDGLDTCCQWSLPPRLLCLEILHYLHTAMMQRA